MWTVLNPLPVRHIRCYIVPMSTLARTLGAMAVVCAVAALFAVPAGGGKSKRFQLVYQSDTRGYYRPCG